VNTPHEIRANPDRLEIIPADLLQVSVGEFVQQVHYYEHLANLDAADAHSHEEMLQKRNASQNGQRANSLREGLVPLARSSRQRGQVYFDTLRMHPDRDFRDLSLELITPLLEHEATADEPAPASIFEAWAALASDSDQDIQAEASGLLVGHILGEHPLMARFTLEQAAPLLRAILLR